jgi:SAM-dependent methyltransferase
VDEALLLSFAELEKTHWWFLVRRSFVLHQAQRYAPPSPARLLEVGCGTGATLRGLSSLFPDAKVTGVEPAASVVQVAAAAGCDVVQGSFEQLPVAAGSVDMLLALDVLEHLDDDAAGLAEAGRALRPGGRLLVTVPALPSLWGPHDELNHHRRRYTRATLCDRLVVAGFRIERVTYFNTVLLPLAWLERTIAKRRQRSAMVSQPAPFVNAVLRRLFALELPLLRRIDLPIGLSLLLVATK